MGSVSFGWANIATRRRVDRPRRHRRSGDRLLSCANKYVREGRARIAFPTLSILLPVGLEEGGCYIGWQVARAELSGGERRDSKVSPGISCGGWKGGDGGGVWGRRGSFATMVGEWV